MNFLKISKRTRQELLNPALEGQRHTQIVKIAVSLHGSGFQPEAIFQQLRAMYDSDVLDSEIRAVISWAQSRTASFTPRLAFNKTRKPQEEQAAPIELITKFLRGFRCSEADLFEASPWRPVEDWRYDSLIFLAGLYEENDLVNIVTDSLEKNGKASPRGNGRTLTRDQWLRVIRDNGTPQSEAGAWIRMNPVDGKGISDANVVNCKYSLIEFDNIPHELQISLVAKLPLPICAILTSGGRSIHAWVRINAKNTEEYRQVVSEMFLLLKRYGVDPANKNSSRLSRLVGAKRVIGAVMGGLQRLIYLNPKNQESRAIL